MILDLIVFILILAFLIIAHEAGHFSTARLFKMYVSEFVIGFPPKVFSKKKGETTYAVGIIPFGGYVKIPGENGKEVLEEESRTMGGAGQAQNIPEERYFYAKPAWQRILVLLAGVFMNFIIGWIILAAVFMTGIPQQVFIGAISPDSPAMSVGLQAGDMVLGYESGDAFIQDVQAHKGTAFTFTIQREGVEREIIVTPRENPPQGEGPLGVSVEGAGIEKQSFISALGKGLSQAWTIFGMIFVLIARLLASVVSGENLFSQLAGPIGIFQVTAQASDLGLVYLAHLIALISLNLAALNVFPFPALDGGRILLVLIEKIKGSPVRMKTQLWLNGVGFVILILFLIAVSIQDITRIF